MTRWMTMICLGTALTCAAGCAGKLPPREELSRAVTKSFDASGCNYSSTSSVGEISLGKLDRAVPGGRRIKNSDGLLDVLRGFSMGTRGAIDTSAGKSEALYDLRYNRDNLEVSLRFPLLVDYNAQTIYIGPSLLHTILGIALPAETGVRGKLIKVTIPELLKDGSEASTKFSRIIDGRRFSIQNMTAMKNAFRDTSLRTLAKLDVSRFSELPLSEQDRREDVARRIRVSLGNGESIDLVIEWIEAVSGVLLQEGVINEDESGLLKGIADRKILEKLLEDFDISLILEVGVSSTGHIAKVESRMGIADSEEKLRVVLENNSAFDSYGSPRFSINPEGSGFIELEEILDAIKSFTSKDTEKEKAKEPSASPPAEKEAPEETQAG